MSFGAMAAWQGWLLIGGAVALAAALFLIKLRPPRVLVPSLLLWRKVLDESRELTLWERIRRAVSLAVTMIIALALALAAARPGRTAGAGDVAAGKLLIVLDSSWSMAARTGSGETRWERGVAEARRLLASASGGEVALATTADGVVEGPTTDGTLIDAALDRMAPGGGQGTAWPRLAGAGSVHFITDGAMPRVLEPTVAVHTVFEPAGNVAITAFQIRPSLSPGNAGDAYLEIANFAAAAQNLHLSVERGGQRIFDRDVDVSAHGALRQVVPIARGGAQDLRAHIDVAGSGQNALTADDDAVLWIDRAQPLSVTVVGTHADWLRPLFQHDPDVRATFVTPDAYTAAAAQPSPDDVIVFDRWAPPAVPARPSMLFAPPATTPWLAGTAPDALPGVPAPARDERRPRWEVPGTHPVVRGVDPYTLTIDRARAYSDPSLVPVAQSARGTPLVSVRQSTETRLVVVSFGADESNLAAAPGFPVLVGNALDWLARPAPALAGSADDLLLGRARVREALEPGLAVFDRGVARVLDPEGAGVPLRRVNENAVGTLRRPGLYVAEGGGARSTIAVNVGSTQVSNLERTTPFAPGRTHTVSSGASARAWWLYCALAAFGLLVAEWWTWQRRITV